MKTIFLKVMLLLTFLISGLAGYEVYKDNQMKEMLSFNTEALAQEEVPHYHYNHLQGSPVECKLYVYINMSTGLSVTYKEEQPSLSANCMWKREVKKGIKDLCPNSGNGCNPFSCQEVTYIP